MENRNHSLASTNRVATSGILPTVFHNLFGVGAFFTDNEVAFYVGKNLVRIQSLARTLAKQQQARKKDFNERLKCLGDCGSVPPMFKLNEPMAMIGISKMIGILKSPAQTTSPATSTLHTDQVDSQCERTR